MSPENQDALRCAEVLMYLPAADAKGHAYLSDSSAHICRLVAENDTLREDLRKFREAASCERDLRQEQERHAAALVQQMLEALDTCGGDQWDGFFFSEDRVRSAITAIRQHLGQKGETG